MAEVWHSLAIIGLRGRLAEPPPRPGIALQVRLSRHARAPLPAALGASIWKLIRGQPTQEPRHVARLCPARRSTQGARRGGVPLTGNMHRIDTDNAQR
jgi:hypothetical protein